MRIHIFLIIVLFLKSLILNAQDCTSKAIKESGYIVVNCNILKGLDTHYAYYFLNSIDSLNICTDNLTNSCFDKNGFHEIYDYSAHDICLCCLYNISSAHEYFPDSLWGKLKDGKLIPDSIIDGINLENYRMKELETIKPFTLLKDYTHFSYKNSKYKTISYYLICKADVFYCVCSKMNEFSTGREIALVKIENVQILSMDEIVVFDNFFKKYHKTKNYRKIKLPFSVTDKK